MNVYFKTITASKFATIQKDPHTFYNVITKQAGGLYDENDNPIYSWQELLDNNYVEIITTSDGKGAKKGSGSDVVTELDGKLVFGEDIDYISVNGFQNCVNLKSVVIPENVKIISQNAFSGCTGLTSAYLEEGVEGIGAIAFGDCPALTTINIPSSVTIIQTGAFRNTGLTAITIPSRLSLLGGSAFYNCSNLTNVQMRNGADSFGTSTFSSCSSLTTFNSDTEGEVYIDEGTAGVNLSGTAYRTLIYSDTFTTIPAIGASEQLTTVHLPINATSMSANCFQGCKALTTINIPTTLTAIPDYAFSGCKALVALELPSSITSIGRESFNGCSGLSRINSETAGQGTLPSGLLSIGNRAFINCTAFNDITIPDGVTTIDQAAFGFVKHITYHGSATGSPWGAKAIN